MHSVWPVSLYTGSIVPSAVVADTLPRVQEAQPSQPSRGDANGTSHQPGDEAGSQPLTEVPADTNGSTDEIRTVTAGDTPYTSAVSFDDLPLSEELKKVSRPASCARLQIACLQANSGGLYKYTC